MTKSKERILKVKLAISEFLQDVQRFSVDDLYYFFYGIEYFSRAELQRIVWFLIKYKDIKVIEKEKYYFAL